MKTATHHLMLYCLATLLIATANVVGATPSIEVVFETDQITGQEWIHAQANCKVEKQQAYDAFSAIVDYPALHDWIKDTKAENIDSSEYQEFTIEFNLPWPAGNQWSRVQIRRNHSEITWKQIEGSLKKNQGSIAITERNNQAHVDYRAILDMGYPDAFTRGYKERFVSEFLAEMYKRLNRGSDSEHTLYSGNNFNQ